MKKYALLNLLLAAGSLLSCNSDALLEPELPEYFVIDGDTLRIRNDKKLLSANHYGKAIVGDTVLPYRKITLPKPSSLFNLSALKSKENEGKPFSILTIGGALSAGMRDYGWFNEWMITSYPNILANQMGVDFKLPFFDSENYNGIERKVATTFNPTGGPALKLKNVINNRDINLETIKKEDRFGSLGNVFKGETDNYSIPYKNSPYYNRLDVFF